MLSEADNSVIIYSETSHEPEKTLGKLETITSKATKKKRAD